MDIDWEKLTLNEFLGETGDLGVTVQNLQELLVIENTMPDSFSKTTMAHIQRAHDSLVALSIAME